MTPYRSVAVAALATAACMLWALGFAFLTSGAAPVIVFLVGIAFAAWYGGRTPALWATAFSFVAAVALIESPAATPSFPAHGVRVVLMLVVGVAISLLAGSLQEVRVALARENRKLQAFIANLPAGLMVFDASGRVAHANEQARTILRHAPHDRLDAPWSVRDAAGRSVSPRELASARALRGETVIAQQWRYERGDGSPTWVEVSAVPMRDGERITGAVAMFSDIGVQKALQLELEDSRRRLDLALQSANSGWFEWDAATGRSTWSPELEALYGIEPGTYRGTHAEWRSRLHPDDVDRAERDIAAAMSNGGFVSEWRVVLPGNGIRYIHAQGRVWMDGNGKPVRMAGVNMDVTGRHHAEARSAAAEARLAIALDAARMGRWHLDLRTQRLEASATCKSIFGRMPHEPFTYEEAVAAVHPDDRAAMVESLQRALDERRDYAAEYRVVWPDGTVRWIAARGRATHDAEGNPEVLDGVTIDFTGRKRLEEELEQKSARLQEADRRKDQFLAVLGHELRNPLAPLRNAVEIMRLRGEDAGVRDRTTSVMERQLEGLTSLVDELLDVSRIAQGKIRLERRAVPLAQVMDDAAEASQPLMQSRGHRFRVDRPSPEVVVEADRARLVQVLTNLLNNAAKYTDPGGEIEFRAVVAGGLAILSVRDNGIGIPAEAQSRIFEIFSQVDGGLDRSLGGLGLGLNVARRLVEMHGGTIAVHSDGPGCGSLFSVTLPLSASNAQTAAPSPADTTSAPLR
jgi:PAS domain S-box-containing protein